MTYPIYTDRYIDISAKTRVGFNYIKQQFYVTNIDSNNIPYTTYRNTLEGIKGVLGAIGVTTITDEELEALVTTPEQLTKVSCTLQDVGAYIHTLQFNDFKDYPLTIDCEKAKLYIMNTSIIFDLTLNESPRHVRIPRILSYYREKLGLQILEDDMRYFYSLLVSYYHPTCYNQVALNQDTGKYFYNNKFILSNFDNTSNATYTCTYNPNNNAEEIQIGYADRTDTATNIIHLAEPIQVSALEGYGRIILKGAETTMEDTDTTYSADGEYIINSLVVDEEDENTITGFKVSNTIPYSYTFPYKECYNMVGQYQITEMSREYYTITLNSAPDTLLVGDIIIVSGAYVPDGEETISCNGTYTIRALAKIMQNGEAVGMVVTVEEGIPTDFKGSGAYLTKELFISNISNINNKEITLITPLDYAMESGSKILVHTEEDGIVNIQTLTLSEAVVKGATTLKVTENIDNYSFMSAGCPVLYIPVPNPAENAEVLIDVTSVSENAEEIFPLGEFMVDSYEECMNYIHTLSGLEPTFDKTEEIQKIKDNLYKEMGDTIPLEADILDLTTPAGKDRILRPKDITEMEFKGLYSDIYSES